MDFRLKKSTQCLVPLQCLEKHVSISVKLSFWYLIWSIRCVWEPFRGYGTHFARCQKWLEITCFCVDVHSITPCRGFWNRVSDQWCCNFGWRIVLIEWATFSYKLITVVRARNLRPPVSFCTLTSGAGKAHALNATKDFTKDCWLGNDGFLSDAISGKLQICCILFYW